jgi:hypothetical protein
MDECDGSTTNTTQMIPHKNRCTTLLVLVILSDTRALKILPSAADGLN